MGYYNNPEKFIHSGSTNLEDIDLALINYFMECVCSQPGKDLKDIAEKLGVCVIHDSNTGYAPYRELMPDRKLVANKLMEYAQKNGAEISLDEALRLTDDTIYNNGNARKIFEHYRSLSPTYARVMDTRDDHTVIDSKFPIIEELLRRGISVDIDKACEISPNRGIIDQRIEQKLTKQQNVTSFVVTVGIIDSPSIELETMMRAMINEKASEEPDTKTAGRSIK